ncbi:DUF4817 domain-containing protein [Trichonephila clavipes]|nr:DUF4817 domain-containing protein [Trichonephila clavipes]
MYGAVNGNDRGALRLYQERFPSKRMLNHKMFQRLHQGLCENGSFITSTHRRGRQRTVRQTHWEEVILDYVDGTPGTSIRTVARRLYRLQNFTVGLLVDAIYKTISTFSVRNHSITSANEQFMFQIMCYFFCLCLNAVLEPLNSNTKIVCFSEFYHPSPCINPFRITLYAFLME